MKVLEIINCLERYGGVEVFSMNFCKFLSKKIEVFVAILYEKHSDVMIRNIAENVGADHIFILNKKGRFDLRSAIKIATLVKKHNINIIHCEAATLITGYFSHLFSNKKVPVTYTIHSLPDKDAGNNAFLYKIIMKKKYIYGIAISAKNLELCQGFYKKSKLTCIDNGVDLTKFKVLTNLDDRDEDIIIVGRFTEAKNYPFMIRIIKDVIQKISNLKVSIYGTGDLENTIKEEIQKNDISNIKLMGNSDSMCSSYNQAKLFLMCSIFEGTPISLIEAMACGCIPITSNVGGIPDVLPPNYSFCFADDKINVYSDAIVEVLSNKELQLVLQKKLIERAKEFSFNRTINSYLDLFEKLVYRS